MKIDLPWTAVMAELKFIKSPAEIETMNMTEIVEATIMILAPEKWLFEAVLSLTGAALAIAIIWD